MVIGYFVEVPEKERQVHDKSTKFTKDHLFYELPFTGGGIYVHPTGGWIYYFCFIWRLVPGVTLGLQTF